MTNIRYLLSVIVSMLLWGVLNASSLVMHMSLPTHVGLHGHQLDNSYPQDNIDLHVALTNSILFYKGQRSGQLPSGQLSSGQLPPNQCVQWRVTRVLEMAKPLE